MLRKEENYRALMNFKLKINPFDFDHSSNDSEDPHAVITVNEGYGDITRRESSTGKLTMRLI